MPPYTNPLEQARSLAQAGRTGSARKAYKAALGKRPDPQTLIEYAVFEAQHGSPVTARKLLMKAQRLTPNDPAIYINLGEILRVDNRHDEALAHFERACELTNSRDADALYLLAETQRNLEDMENARKNIELAAEISPNDPEIAALLALMQITQGDALLGIESYKRALKADPTNFTYTINLATLFYRLEHWEDAAETFDKASRLGSISRENALDWINTLIYTERGREAVSLAEKLAEAGADPLTSHLAQGSALMSIGDFDGTETHFRAAFAIDNDKAISLEKLSLIRRLRAEDEPALRALAGPNAPKDQRVKANFSLYQLLRNDNLDDAFAALKTANELAFSNHPFDGEQHTAMMDTLAETFSRDFMHARQGQGDGREGPVFIVGMPRSGTTLVETMLASYEDVFAGGERNMVRQFNNQLPGFPGSVIEKDAAWAAQQGKLLYDEMLAAGNGTRFVTDKLPGNYANVGLITWLLPGAKIIYCRRDAMDNCLSCYEQHFHSGLHYAYDLEALAVAYRAHERIMSHWLENSPHSIHIVDYEKLVHDPDSHARALSDFCGLSFNSDSINPENVDRSIATASAWQARQPINANSVGKWKRYGDALQPLKAALEAR